MPNSDIQKKIHTGCNFQTFFYFSFFLVKISKKQLRKTTIQYFQFTMKLFSRPNLEFWRRKKIFMTHFQLKFTFGGQRHKFSMYIVFTTFNWKKGRESDRTSCRYGILQNIWVSTTRFQDFRISGYLTLNRILQKKINQLFLSFKKRKLVNAQFWA